MNNNIFQYMKTNINKKLVNLKLPLSDTVIDSYIKNLYTETVQHLQNTTKTQEQKQAFINYQIKRLVQGIKTTFVSIPNSSRFINKKTIDEKPPWFIIKYPKRGITSDVIFEEIYIPGMAEPLSNPLTWKLNWIKNDAYTLPSAISSTTSERNNSVIRQSVGKFCNNQRFFNLNPWCNKTRSFKYTENFNQVKNQSKIIKSGTSGLGVLELSKLLFSTPTIKKRRRYYLDLKRNGDYGQIFSCRYLLEDDSNYFKAILHPGSLKFGEYLLKTQNLDLNSIRNVMKRSSYFFMNATFCSFDRPASKLAQLIRIPLIYEKPSQYKCYFQVVVNYDDIRSLLPRSGPLSSYRVYSLTGRQIMDIVNYKYIEEKGVLPGPNVYPMWYQLLCIIDTAHDFRGPRLPTNARNPKGPRTAIKNLMSGLYVSGINVTSITTPYGTYTMPDLIKVIFDRISDIEEAASEDIIKFSSIASNQPVPQPGTKFTSSFGASFATEKGKNRSYLNGSSRNGVATIDDLLARINSCIVLDAIRRELPKDLTKRIAFLSAKFIDPGT